MSEPVKINVIGQNSPVKVIRVKNVVAGGSGGVTDHGALTGLADDDHLQYHNDARGDARYDATGAAAAVQANLDLMQVDVSANATDVAQALTETADNAAAITGKAAASHTHATTDLSQTSATNAQVLTWVTGSGWIPQTPSSSGGDFMADGSVVMTGQLQLSHAGGITTSATYGYIKQGSTNYLLWGNSLIFAYKDFMGSGDGTIKNGLINKRWSQTCSNWFEGKTYTVATLPTGTIGMSCYVSDASVAHSGNSGSVVAGGGANFVPVYHDGTNWKIS